MASGNRVFGTLKPIFHTFIFELTSHGKKFITFSMITILQVFLFNYLPFIIGSHLSGSLDWFYFEGTIYFVIILTFTICFFFSGIICSEYKDKTGLTILPLINKHELIIGKYLANLFLVIGIATIHYLTLILLGYNFYGEPVFYSWILSYGFSILYIVALGSIATFFSSFMSSPSSVFIVVFGFMYIGFDLLSQFVQAFYFDFEPFYSLAYISVIIPNILLQDFFTSRMYISVEGAIAVLLFYAISFFILALLLFTRREL